MLGEPRALAYTESRLEAFFSSYRSVKRKPQRVRVLLQAIAFMCSAEMLAMLWMVQLGAGVKELHLNHQRDHATKLKVVLDLPGCDEASDTFESAEHWDFALLQFASVAKVDELPVIGNFVGLNFDRLE